MKFKGEKELLAESVYAHVEEEYETVILELSSYISDLNSNNEMNIDQRLEEIAQASSKIHLYRLLVESIYNGDWGMSQLKMMYSLSSNKNLLKNLHYIIYQTDYSILNKELTESKMYDTLNKVILGACITKENNKKTE